ncbi:MAG TPA: GerMN domain-containing protein [Candidatus Aphodomonas merdavium]|nr:GerMN domain-containing protein [Candidatus Aphodomonas merdavium]
MTGRCAKKCIWLAPLLVVVLLLGGCSEDGENVRATPAPQAASTSASPAEIAVGTGGSRMEMREVALYFRMQGENMLAREVRKIYLSRDDQLEKAIVRAIIDGPSASLLDLSSVFNPGTQVLSTFATGSILNVTLSREFLSAPPDVPANWYNYAYWREEVMMRRRLAFASVVLAVTDATEYTAVQFLVQERSDDLTGKRILRKEIFFDEVDDTAILGPMTREEGLLLTQYNSTQVILESVLEKDLERLYRFVAQADGERPTQEAFIQAFSEAPRALIAFSAAPGSVSEDGKTAVMTVDLTFLDANGTLEIEDYPLHLTRENGLWKIGYATLWRMMEAD